MTKVWAPHAGSQTLFLACPVFECLLEGTRGGGKTAALLMSFAQYVGVGFGQAWRGVLFRETYPQLADVAAKSKAWFRLFWPAARFNESSYTWKFPDGEELLLRSGIKEDDYWDHHGSEYPWIGFEELTNWRSLTFYEMMHSCCRSAHPGMPRMVRATTNPYGRGHAEVKARFKIGEVNPGTIIRDTDGRERCYVHSDVSENLTLLANDPKYMKSLDGIKDPNRKKAWRFGSWDINIGAFLADAWDERRHVARPFPIPSHWKVWMTLDWGYAKPYCAHWFAKDPEGKTYLWRELYGIALDDDGKPIPNQGTKETPDKVAQRIVAREAHDERVGYTMSMRITGPDLFARGGSQYGTQITHAQTFRRAGLNFRPWWAGPGSRKAGAMLVKQTLEEDGLVIFDTCVHTIRTVPTLNPDPDDPDDVATDEEDHAFDSLKAGLMRRTSNPPNEQESLSGDPEAGGAYVQEDGRHRIDRIQR